MDSREILPRRIIMRSMKRKDVPSKSDLPYSSMIFRCFPSTGLSQHPNWSFFERIRFHGVSSSHEMILPHFLFHSNRLIMRISHFEWRLPVCLNHSEIRFIIHSFSHRRISREIQNQKHSSKRVYISHEFLDMMVVCVIAHRPIFFVWENTENWNM